MILNIPVIEAMDIIKDKTHRPISLKVVDSKTINVGYDFKLLLGTKFVAVDLIVDKIVDTDIYLLYTTGSKLVKKAINMLMSFFGDSEVFNRPEDGKLVLHLDKIEKVNNVFDKITLEDISFDSDSILVKFMPKM